MIFNRSSGIILHPTCLPGPDGMGDIGIEAYQWIDFLNESGCNLWQVLPLGPTGFGDSPYQCFSAFAGNPYLISVTTLLEDNLLSNSDLSDRPSFPNNKILYGDVITWKLKILNRALERFSNNASADLKKEFENFQTDENDWLDNFSLFMAIKEINSGKPWNEWAQPLRKRLPSSITRFRKDNADLIYRHTLKQFLFFHQWNALRKYANEKNIQIIGDIPIFVAYDSADTWAHPELFYLDKNGLSTVVAGVPPDYFSPTGQLWGNPLYRWDIHKETGYSWWIQRVKASLKLFDIIRLDHFRGFASYWEVPANLPTAEIGRWVKGPGVHFFESVQQVLGDLPIIAEDLGFITPDVISLRDRFNFPGMKIFQFAFSTDSSDPFLPHNYSKNCVTYTGTHDNDTTKGWYETAPENERDLCRRYLSSSGTNISWDMIRAVWSSVSMICIAPFQDFLELGSDSRMNFPGKSSGNWTWRLSPNVLTDELLNRIKEINFLYSRPQLKTLSEGHI